MIVSSGASLPSGVSRRAFLLMPAPFAVWLATVGRRERKLPDARESGHGPAVRLVLFTKSGARAETIQIHKMVRSDAEWRRDSTPEEFAVTRRAGTEAPFTGRYWNLHTAGLYRCACCGNALFSSRAKFDSGTGWPSFSEPLAEENIESRSDTSLPEVRTEILCRKCDAHLGHVFSDGPPPGGLRYCINSVALRFTPEA